MKCSNCGVEIKPEFAHAISANKCPACGKAIIPGAGLGAYLDMKKLLEEKFKDMTNAEDVVMLVISNFNVRKIGEVSKDEYKTEEEKSVVADGIILEKKDKKDLQKMREEALKDAISDRYEVELGDGNTMFPAPLEGGIGGVLEEVGRVKQEQKLEKMLSGVGGFKRAS